MKLEAKFAKPWKPEAAGDILEGTYVGSKEVESDRFNGKPFTVYQIQVGKELRSASGGMLASYFEQIPRNTKVKITFTGMIAVKNGNAKNFDVEVPDGTTLLDLGSRDEDALPL